VGRRQGRGLDGPRERLALRERHRARRLIGAEGHERG
jgi:hypothetical protein